MPPARYFLYGTLCHAPLLGAVLGRSVRGRPARLAGYAVFWAEGEAFPVIRSQPGAAAEGLLIEDIAPDEAERLDFYESGFGYVAVEREVETGAGPSLARIYFPDRVIPTGAPWRLGDWASAWGALVTEAAGEVMALMGARPAETIFRRYPQILVRAASRLRAAESAPASLRRQAAPGDVVVESWRQPYAGYFAVEEMDLRFRRFDGDMSPSVCREAFVSGDAATVLPYDPKRDRVLLIEQFRSGPHARGDAQPWLLEPIAGRVDPGESPEAAVRREALEEAGLDLGELLPVAAYYPSPAAKSEYLYSFIGLADLPDHWRAGAAGVADENEDIRAHVIGFDRLMQLVASGEAENGPLLISALHLAQARERLRRAS